MAYSAPHGVLLYGGFNATGSQRDLWRWDGARWERMDVAGPTFTEGMSLVATPEGPMVVGAGMAEAEPGTARLRAWRWAGGQWSAVSEPGPLLTVGPAVVYDEARRRLVVFAGGLPNGAPLSEVWEFADGRWQRMATSP